MVNSNASSTSSNNGTPSPGKETSHSQESVSYEMSAHQKRFKDAGYCLIDDLVETPNNHFIILKPELYPKEFQPILHVLANHPSLKTLLTKHSTTIPKRLVSQYWKSAEFDAASKTVVGYISTADTITTGKVTIGKEALQISFDIPRRIDLGLKEYAANPSDDEILQFLNFIGYEGGLSKRGTFKRKMLPRKWNVLFSILNRCLTGKVGSTDQGSYQVFAIMYGVYYGLNLDYASLILSEFTGTVERYTKMRMSEKVKTSKKKDGTEAPSPNHLIFPRFISVVIEGLLAHKPQFLSGGPLVKNHELTAVVPQTGPRSGEYSLDRPLSRKMLRLVDKQLRKAYSREFRAQKPKPETPPPQE